MTENKRKKEYGSLSDKTLAHLKEKFDFGRGVEVTMASTDPETNKTEYTYHYTCRLPKLEVTTANAKRLLDVEVVSVEEYDKKLLHFLHKKTLKK